MFTSFVPKPSRLYYKIVNLFKAINNCLISVMLVVWAKSISFLFLLPLHLILHPLNCCTLIWGPSPTPFTNRYHYYIHFIDACTCFTWVYLLKHKSDPFQTFIHFKTQVELQFVFPVNAIQSGLLGCGGGKVGYRAFTAYLHNHGILHTVSCPLTHKQNDTAEKKHRHLICGSILMI